MSAYPTFVALSSVQQGEPSNHPLGKSASWYCHLDGTDTNCEGSAAGIIDSQLHGIPIDRFRQAVKELSRFVRGTEPCEVVSATLAPYGDKGTAQTNVNGPSLYLTAQLNCSVDDRLNSGGPSVRRVSESSHHYFGIDCNNRESHYYASGSDYYSDQTRKHWDSQGTGGNLPWSAVPKEGTGIRRVFDAVCIEQTSVPLGR
jgi:hypothetical protein